MALEKRISKYSFWKYFEEISMIPRGSGNTEKIANYLVDFAKAHDLKSVKDDIGNVVIYVPATKGRDHENTIIIQGHMDMVAVKDEGVEKNLEKDSLELFTDGNLLGAKGTSLGGDDGIALAYGLALASDESISHPALELVFTVDEETGMDGAMKIKASTLLKGKTMINIDSEAESEVLTGCAGGSTVVASVPVERKERAANVYELKITGLKGGHSGTEIGKGGVSAVTIIARFFEELSLVRTRVMEINVGDKDNVIATNGYMKFICSAPKSDVIETIEFYTDVLKEEFASREPDLNIEFNVVGEGVVVNALHRADSDRIMHFLMALPQGVEAMSYDMSGLVETSNNVGFIELKEDELDIRALVRSSYDSAKQALCDKIISIVKLAGGTATQENDYPGWVYNKDSKIRAKYINAYRELFGKKLKPVSIHAGVECGSFVEKIEGLDVISIGPDILDIHTTKERLDMDSAERVYEAIKQVLK